MAKLIRHRDELISEAENELIFLCGAFLLGAIFGSFFASGFSANGLWSEIVIQTWNLKIFMLIHGGLLLVIFTAPFLPAGQMAAPCSMAAEGFLLAVMVTCTIQTYGWKGYFPALMAWFLTGMALLFLLLFMGCRGRMLTLGQKGKGADRGFIQRRQLGPYFRCGVAAFLLLWIIGYLHCYGAARCTRWLVDKLSML